MGASLGTIVVAAILVIVVGIAIWSMIRNHKKGKSSCGCDCSTCPGCSQSVSDKV